MGNFGWRPPSEEKRELHRRKWGFGSHVKLVGADVAVEVQLPIDERLIEIYNQGDTQACTGYSASWATSINNGGAFDAWWLYNRGKEIDNDPSTTTDMDLGGYIYAVLDVLRKEGHKSKLPNGESLPVNPIWGIESYYWIYTIDELRTALSLNRPCIFGIPWYSGFMKPSQYKNLIWIGRTRWGTLAGGHAICACGCSDELQAIKLINSWGKDYPPVWISYKNVMKLLEQGGECAALIDWQVDMPKAVEKLEMPFEIFIGGDKKYQGTLVEV